MKQMTFIKEKKSRYDVLIKATDQEEKLLEYMEDNNISSFLVLELIKEHQQNDKN